MRYTFALAGILVLASCSDDGGTTATEATSGVSDALLTAAPENPGEWLTHGGDYSERRYSTLSQIDTESVSRLGLEWAFDTGLRGGHESTPLVHDGVMYATGPWSVVYALDARTGALLWSHDPQVPRLRGRLACCDVVNRGAALYGDRVYVGTLDGRLLALDAETGAVDWEVITVDQDMNYTITGAPRVVNGLVMIGNGGAELGVRGYISAYRADSGALAWRTYTVPGDPSLGFESDAMERAAETWSGEWWSLGGGGTAWDGMAYDPGRGLLYVGTGNGSPWNARVRSPGGGDNLYLSSILAIRATDGEIVWHYQTTPSDHWDFTATQPLVLATLEIEGTPRDVIMQAPKNGFFYVIDRETGELVSAENYVPVTWADGVDLATGRPNAVAEARYLGSESIVAPTVFGGHNWQPMSYSERTGLMYVPIHEITGVFSENLESGLFPGVWNTRTDLGIASVPQGFLLAWDPTTQQEAWRAPLAAWWNGGVLSTAGGLVFQGGADGRLVAYDDRTGEVRWESSTGLGIIAPPMTWELDGTQYLTVMAGWGGVGGRNSSAAGDAAGNEQRGRLLTYVLDGAEAMPDIPRIQPPPATLTVDLDRSPERVAEGGALYAVECLICHGGGGASGAAMPNLLASSQATHDIFLDIVLGGAREPLGMPSFASRLDEEQVRSIQAWLLSRSPGAGGD